MKMTIRLTAAQMEGGSFFLRSLLESYEKERDTCLIVSAIFLLMWTVQYFVPTFISEWKTDRILLGEFLKDISFLVGAIMGSLAFSVHRKISTIRTLLEDMSFSDKAN